MNINWLVLPLKSHLPTDSILSVILITIALVLTRPQGMQVAQACAMTGYESRSLVQHRSQWKIVHQSTWRARTQFKDIN